MIIFEVIVEWERVVASYVGYTVYNVGVAAFIHDLVGEVDVEVATEDLSKQRSVT